MRPKGLCFYAFKRRHYGACARSTDISGQVRSVEQSILTDTVYSELGPHSIPFAPLVGKLTNRAITHGVSLYRHHPSPALRFPLLVSEIEEIILIKPEVVTDLVQDGDANLFTHNARIRPAAPVRENPPTKKTDILRKLDPFLDRPLRDRHARVKPAKLVPQILRGRPITRVKIRQDLPQSDLRRLIVHDERDFLQQIKDTRREFRDDFVEQRIKPLSFPVIHPRIVLTDRALRAILCT